jgi:pimeloyl-ACP methyl ester carboxylesterase
VVALDFRGRGQSDYDPQPDRYAPATYVRDVIELLDRLGIKRAIFVGTSLGGIVTMLLAALAPDRVAAAVLNDIGPEVGQVGLERIKTYIGRDVRFRSWNEAAAAIAANNRDVFERYTDEDWIRMAKRNCREEAGEIRFDYDMAVALPFKAGAPSAQIDMWPLFSALAQKPLLVLRGEKSELLTADTLAKMQAVAPAMRSAVIPGVGHPPDLGEPEAVAALGSFLEELGEL